jgi:glycosyltransferase involved in cell wall biosynthesis
MKDLSKLKVAIVHDWLYGGGAELVVEQLHILFPDAPIYTSYCTDEWRKRLDHKVVTGWLQHFGKGKMRKFIPMLRIWWYTHLDLREYDLVISSSGAEAKGIKVPKDTLHVNYCHAPTHYYWSRYDEYLEHPGFGQFNWLARIGLKLLVGPLRRWDYKAAQRPDYIIANSTHIKNDIRKYYGRDSIVIFPPVYFERFQKPANAHRERHGLIISGRQTAYKRFDLAIQACTMLNIPLTVIGDGPDHQRLRSLAGPSVKFLGHATDSELERQFASAKALIFPGLDDFGITAVEALASGTPVIAYKGGGALDYVVEHRTGLFFDEPSAQSLAMAINTFNEQEYTTKDIKAFANRFSKESFQKTIHKTLLDLLK